MPRDVNLIVRGFCSGFAEKRNAQGMTAVAELGELNCGTLKQAT